MEGFNFTAGAMRAGLATPRSPQFGQLARSNGLDLPLGLRAQFEDIGQLSR